MTCQKCEQNIHLLTRRVIANGSTQYVYQCQVCGRPSNPISHQKAIQQSGGRKIAEFDPEIEVRYRDGLAQKARDEISEGKRQFRAWYSEYLKTPEWRQRRELVMRRAHGICEGCGLARASEVHHTTYDHVGEEFLWELVAICSPCHTRYHEKPDEAEEPDQDEVSDEDFRVIQEWWGLDS